MNPVDAKRIMAEGCDLLTELGIKHWLSAGTALGAYRDGLSDEFLNRDTDIDVGVLGSDTLGQIVPAFENAGFKRVRVYPVQNLWAQCAMEKDSILFDIYFFNEHDEIVVNINEYGMMIKPRYMIQRLGELEIDGRTYPVPRPIESYLELRYGMDWKTPKKEKVAWQDECANLVLR
jgi:phosphorylcholine metabolism protein LicD